MIDLGKYGVVSFDMFQTLVDVDSRKDEVLKAIFAGRYEAECADRLWEEANAFVYSYFHGMGGNRPFVPVVRVFEECYRSLFPRYPVSIQPEAAARFLAEAHSRAASFPEAEGVIAAIARSRGTCVVSDTDEAMIRGLPERFGIKTVFTSQAYRSYKSDASGELFRAAIGALGVEPGRLLHVGDGSSDVLAAKAAGADCVWLNRSGRAWKGSAKPDYVVTDLRQLIE
jgi:FMN hydrolase / 5-amino-6-(5-phospho-D-ribitylamino)uracil phosphatase